MKLILPESMDAPTIPEWFIRGLNEMDKGLVIYWNRMIGRFVVDRCTNPDYHTHNQSCQRANVLIVEDEDHGYMSPCQRILDKIKSMDAWSNFNTLHNLRRSHEIAKEEFDAKRKQDASDEYKYATLDDRVQINRANNLIQQHDVSRVHR